MMFDTESRRDAFLYSLDWRANARTCVIGVVAASLLLSGCPGRNPEAGARRQPAIQSIYTGLDAASCKPQADKNDPNETPYLLCPGVGGYELIVRRVDAGRSSIDVVDASRRAFPLNYQEFVTRRMFSLDSKAEWRAAAKDGVVVPIALVVRVQAHEDNENPEKVTQTYFAVAKIAPNQACVTARIPEGKQSDAEVRSAADSAAERECVQPQPPLTAGGIVIR